MALLENISAEWLSQFARDSKPFRDELLSVEGLEERATALAAMLVVYPGRRPRARNIFPRLRNNYRVLRRAYRILAEDLRSGRSVTPASEWLLDNFHLVSSEIRDIHQHLPRHFSRKLPTVAVPAWKQQARVYAMAVELLRHSDSRIDLRRLVAFASSFQRVAPLTIGELWAWPSMLKLALIENIRRLAEEILEARDARLAADAFLAQFDRERAALVGPLPSPVLHISSVVHLLHRMREFGLGLSSVQNAIDDLLRAHETTAEEAIRVEHQRQAATQESIANAIGSLRLSSSLDWREYFESVSLVEQVLHRDPSGIYTRMDFLSRDRQRQAVDELADSTGEAQLRVALRAVESARQAATRAGMSDRSAHVGYHLVGRGRRALEADLAYRPRPTRRLRRIVFRHATACYLLPILALTCALLGGVAWYAGQAGGSVVALAAAVILLAIPAADVSIGVVQRAFMWAIPPRRLLRLELADRVPDDARTMVVIPTLFTSVASVRSMLEHIEVQALANLDPAVHFAILSDVRDAPEQVLPEDQAIIDEARHGIENLNERFGQGHTVRFFFFHRERRWNAAQHTWMGWERKRGKLEEFNRLLRGATDTSFVVQVGELAILPSVRYVITLDTDTRLARDGARSLIGIAAHPMNRPRFDVSGDRVVEGYGLLQPRVSVTMASAAGSLFARTYAGHTGVDPYTTAVSDVYQDLFDEGIFAGKGLYDVDAFAKALEGRVPENALLSHDLFEGLYARTAFVSDVEVVDDYPSSVLTHTRRQHRWVRGDWQILWWLLPYVPTRTGLARNRLPLISRWKILDNLRRSLLAPAMVLALIAGWTVLPGSAGVWTLLALGAALAPVPLRLTRLLTRPERSQRLTVFARALVDDLMADAARAGLQIVFLAYHAYEMVHAIVVTLVRLVFTKQRLLEWETFASASARSPAPRAALFLQEMAASPIVVGISFVLMLALRPHAWKVALPILVLWGAAPWVAFVLSHPVRRRRDALADDDAAFFLDVAKRTWRYFEAVAGEEDHFLPPDNVQTQPARAVAHRTSPTNIGMALLATLAARDLQFISTVDLIERLDRILTTIERLERFEGHLLNWYDTRTLQPLSPPYISTVDSGNLGSALLTVAAALDDVEGDLDPQHVELARSISARATVLFDEINFRFLYDPRRQLFTIGYRLADADGPGRRDASYYDLLASEARVASFLAIAKGDVPESHWFHLGRSVTSVHGAPVLLSWSATMFEYLMPLLVMRSYPETLLDESARMAVARQREYAAEYGVPWGISESAYNVVDRHDTYQYKAFGVPGLGLKRGLGDELVIAPYATALAAMLEPARAAANLRRLARLGLMDEYGYYDAIDYSNRDVDDEGASRKRRAGVPVHTYMAHHEGMTLVALTNALLNNIMVERFHSNPRVKATELLLQERIPRYAPTIEPRPRDEMRVASPLPPTPVRRYRSADTVYPHAQFLSNGSFVSVVTNAGGGSISWRGLSVTRARRDPTRDLSGTYLYLRDVRSGRLWSPTLRPTNKAPDDYRVEFRPDKATFYRRDDDIATRLEVAVSTEDDVEVRRLTVTNHGSRAADIDITSYVEIVLAPAADDLAHPSFVKLFLETESLPELPALLCHPRPRDSRAPAAWAMHVLSLEGHPQSPVECETDRMRFIGRGRDVDCPVSLEGAALSGTTGVVLDPIFSLRQRVRVAPGSSVRVSFSTGVCASRDAARALAHKYGQPSAAPRTFALAFTHAQIGLRHLDVSTDDAQLFERLASRVLYEDRSLRAAAEVLAANELSQAALWPHSISGDLPILLVIVVEGDDLSLVRQALQAQEYWRLKGLSSDVVVLNEHPIGYMDEVQAQLTALLDTGPWRGWKHRPGGVFLLRGDRLGHAERTLLQSVARAVLRGDLGDLRAQLDRPYAAEMKLPPEPADEERLAPDDNDEQDAIEVPATTLSNGIAGFADNGRTYVITLDGSRSTPLPWVNVIANPRFGTIVTESGGMSTWSGNSRENRITPHWPDAVTDPTAEAFYIRDEESGRAWTPTPGPMQRRRHGARSVIRHGPGQTTFAGAVSGVRHSLEVFVDPEDPVKFSRLTLTNTEHRARRLSVFTYVEWSLGPPRLGQQSHVVTTRDETTGAILATNAYREESSRSCAFLYAGAQVRSATASRRSFVGRNGSLARPSALKRATLDSRFGAGLDPCGVLQLDVPLEAGQTQEIVFLLGQGDSTEHARQLIARHGSSQGAALAKTRGHDAWEQLLGVIQVQTPDDSFDALFNSWLLYQDVSCRLWTRGGYYQPGGAFGFRDQLQDVLALLLTRPDLTREHLVRASGRQFLEGDVQHWWHEPSGKGLRSRCSDDLLWLPFAVAEYVRNTGDETVLNERTPYLEAPPLAEHEQEAYGEVKVSERSASVYEHCLDAITRGMTTGAHGLPLFGSCDWNDGMNRVGSEGHGESVWLGFFLYAVLAGFAPICDARNDRKNADRLRAEAHRLAAKLDLAWDGEWYKRGYYDDGTPLGSAQNDECRIDSIAQTWAVISGAAPPHLAERAMDAVRASLVSRSSQILLLLSPPFDHSQQEPGYIKGYPPGIRENGGIL